jgi:hypothetical protein
VIDAVELPRVALALAAHQRAAVPARIDQRAHVALPVAAEDHRPAGDVAGAEVAGLLKLGGVTDVNPAVVEDGAVLGFQHLVGHEHLAVDGKSEVFVVLDDEAAVALSVSVARGDHIRLHR